LVARHAGRKAPYPPMPAIEAMMIGPDCLDSMIPRAARLQ
jgi:hypothetical protein